MAKPNQVTDRLRAKLPELWATDMTAAEIGERFGVSSSTVASLAKKTGLGGKPKKLRMYPRKGVMRVS